MPEAEKSLKNTISPELAEKMSQAGTQEALKAVWAELAEILNLIEHERGSDQFLSTLAYCYQCFVVRGGACDSSVKDIFSNHLEALGQWGIPREFLLQCVRVGAVAAFMRSVEVNPLRPVSLDSAWAHKGGTALDDDGYSWANGLLQEMDNEKKQAAVVAERRRLEEFLRREEEALARISEHMYEPGFSLNEDEIGLLRPKFSGRLSSLRSVFQNRKSASVVREFHSGEYANREITPELFEVFKSAVMASNKYLRLTPEIFEMMNPRSPFFYVAIKNECTTFGEFISSVHNNFHYWFKL